MAYVKDWTWNYNTATTATSISGFLPQYTQNDLLLLVPSADTGTQTYTATGYTSLTAAVNTASIGVLYKLASSSETAPSVTYSVAETANLRVISVGDVNISSPFAPIWQGLNIDKGAIQWYNLNGTLLRVAQSFRGNGETINKVRFYLKKTGNPTGAITAVLYNHTGTFGSSSTPSTTTLATSNTIDASTLSTSGSWVEFTFSTAYVTALNTFYTIAVQYTGTASNTVDVAYLVSNNTLAPLHAGNAATYTGTTWTAAANNDLCHFIRSQNGFITTAVSTAKAPIPDIMADNDNVLLLYLCAHSNTAVPVFLEGAVMEDGADGSAHSDAFSWQFLPKALTPTKELVYMTNIAAGAAIILVIGIRSSSDNTPQVVPAYPLFDYSKYIDPINGVTAYNSNTAFAATYTTNFSTTLAGRTAANGTVAAAADVGLLSYHSMGQLTGSATENTWAGAALVLNASNYLNHTNKNILCHVKPSTPKTYQTTDPITKSGVCGVAFGVYSTAASAWVMWHVHGSNTLWNSATHIPIVINPSNTTNGVLGSAGTLDTTSIKGFGFAISGFVTAPVFQFGSLWALDTTIVCGGSALYPITLKDIYKAVALGKERMSVLLQGSNQALILQPIQIGDSSVNTICNLQYSTIEFPEIYNKNSKNVFYCSNPNVVGLTLQLNSADSLNISNTTLTSKSKYHFIIHQLSSITASVLTDGFSLINAGTVQIRYYTFNYSNFTECNTIDMISGFFQQCNFTNSTIYTNTSNLDKIQNCTFTKTSGTGHALVINAIDTPNVYLVNCKFIGYATSNGNTGNEAIYVNTLGNLTIYVTGDYQLPSIRTLGANVRVVKVATLTLTNLVANTEVRIYNKDNGLELFGEEDVVDGFISYNYEYTGTPITVVIAVFNVNYKDKWIELTLTGTNITLPIQQEFDRNYKNP